MSNCTLGLTAAGVRRCSCSAALSRAATSAVAVSSVVISVVESVNQFLTSSGKNSNLMT